MITRNRNPIFHKSLLCLQIIFLCVCNANLFGQAGYLDSLKSELTKPHTDSVIISLSQEIGYHLLLDSPKVSRQYFSQAYELCKKNDYREGMGTSLAYISMSCVNMDELDSAYYYLDLAMDIFMKDTSVRGQSNYGSLLNEMANVEKAQGKYETAIQHYLESLNNSMSFDTKEKYINISVGYYNVALVFEEMKEFGNAVNYCEKAIEAAETGLQKATDTAYLSALHNRLAIFKLGLIHNLLETNETQKALSLLQSEQEGIKSWNNNNMNAFLYTEWGNYYAKTNRYDVAIESYKKALDYAANIDQRKMLALKALGNIYKRKGNYAAAEAAYRQILDTRQSRNKLKIQTDAMREIAEILLLDKRYKKSALAFSRYNLLSDSLNEMEVKRLVNDLESKYQVKQKQDSILVLQKNNQIQSMSLSKRRNVNYVLISGIGLLLLIGALVYRNMKSRHLILKQAETLHKQHIQELEKEHLLVAAHSLMKGQEEERSRLAKDLHDGVGGLLSGVKLSLSTMKGNVFLSEENARAVETIINQLDSSINELRRVSHNMMPEALIKFGLKETLENYCERINQTGGLQVKFQAYGLDERMEQDTEITLYRIVQELLNNVIKHAEAKNVLIQLTREKDKFSLTVEDDGKGFDPETANTGNHSGLTNIKSRASLLDGSVDISTSPGQGTSVTIIGKC